MRAYMKSPLSLQWPKLRQCLLVIFNCWTGLWTGLLDWIAGLDCWTGFWRKTVVETSASQGHMDVTKQQERGARFTEQGHKLRHQVGKVNSIKVNCTSCVLSIVASFPPSVYPLSTCDSSHAFPIAFCILQVIKNWRREQPTCWRRLWPCSMNCEPGTLFPWLSYVRMDLRRRSLHYTHSLAGQSGPRDYTTHTVLHATLLLAWHLSSESIQSSNPVQWSSPPIQFTIQSSD